MTWEDAPSHICRGGDIRGLAFCCPPMSCIKCIAGS